MFKTVMCLRELVLLKEGPEQAKEDGIYTTASLLKAELELVKRAVSLSQREHAPPLLKKRNSLESALPPHKQAFRLSEEQSQAVAYMTKGQQLSCILGCAT